MPCFLPIDDHPGETLPAGKVVAIGKNYRAHVDAMGDPAPPEPLFFMKPPSAVVPPGGAAWYPSGCEELHPEAELAVLVGRRARDLAPEAALEHVAGFAAGLDMTDRGWQRRAKEAGWPWERAKAFDGSAPVGPVLLAEEAPSWEELVVTLEVNGAPTQEADPRAMLRGVPEVLAAASRWFTLEPGDLVFTGAPAGTAPVRPGDHLDVGLRGRARARFEVLEDRDAAP